MREPFLHVYPDLEDRIKDTLQWRFLNCTVFAQGNFSKAPTPEAYEGYLRRGTMHMQWFTEDGTRARWRTLQRVLRKYAVECPQRLTGYWLSFLCITGHGPDEDAVQHALGNSQWCEEDPMAFWSHVQEELARLTDLVGDHV